MKLAGLVQLAMGQVIGYFKKFCDIIMTPTHTFCVELESS